MNYTTIKKQNYQFPHHLKSQHIIHNYKKNMPARYSDFLITELYSVPKLAAHNNFSQRPKYSESCKYQSCEWALYCIANYGASHCAPIYCTVRKNILVRQF